MIGKKGVIRKTIFRFKELIFMKGKGSLYPFKIRVKEPTIERIMDDLIRFNTHIIEGDKKNLRNLSYKLAPIRNDISIGFDSRNNDSIISLKNKFLKLEKIGNDYIFRF